MNNNEDHNYPTVLNIASNLPDYWFTGGKPATDREKFDARMRAKMLEHVKGYAEAWNEEIEAQLHYYEHQNEKKSNPSAFYEAWNRLKTARWAVKAFHDNDIALVQLTRMVTEELKQEALAKFASPAEAFKAWLVKEVQLYYTAKKHPERVFHMCSPDSTVYTKRYAVLAQALRTLSVDGLNAAFKLWKDELEERYAGIHGKDTSAFIELEGRSKYSGKTGYWLHDQSAQRPILSNDPAEIQRNLEKIARSSTRKARAERFDYEVEIPAVAAPKRPRGRPKGVRNKPKPRPVSKEVAAWQAEADRKLGYSSE